MKKTLILVLALLLVLFPLAACGANSTTEKSSDAAASANESAQNVAQSSSDPGTAVEGDYGWVKLDVPDGYVYVKESDQYVTLQNATDSKVFVRIARDYLMGRSIEEVALTQISNNTEKYRKGADGFFSGLSWKVVDFEQNGQECRMLFAECGDGEHYLRVTAFGLTENDFALQVILGNIRLDLSQL